MGRGNGPAMARNDQTWSKSSPASAHLVHAERFGSRATLYGPPEMGHGPPDPPVPGGRPDSRPARPAIDFARFRARFRARSGGRLRAIFPCRAAAISRGFAKGERLDFSRAISRDFAIFIFCDYFARLRDGVISMAWAMFGSPPPRRISASDLRFGSPLRISASDLRFGASAPVWLGHPPP